MMTLPQAAETAHEYYPQTKAEADQALELGNETGTPAGDRAYELGHAADVAYDRHLDAWRDTQGHLQVEADAETEPEAGQ
jgi:hypothetical protein